MNSAKGCSTYIDTCNISFAIYDFNGQTTIPTDDCQDISFAIFLKIH